MQLSRQILPSLNGGIVTPPEASVFELPEKVLQFGTGVLLRGLPDYFIDKANKQQLFNGRIVVVKSTTQGVTDAFRQQDGLYTHVERGIEEGKSIEKISINASISRVLSAKKDWDTILACAKDPYMQVIISNTTEMGIVLDLLDVQREKPESFPGRILAFLEARYKAFEGKMDAGMVIIPTELISDNGTSLQEMVLTLATKKYHSEGFIHWLSEANDFCNSLVDRIVPGKLPTKELALMQQRLGYSDELMIMSEPYRLWAIEVTRKRSKDILSFSKADSGVFLSPDINKFREIKLRLLNGTHTLSCGLAFLAGFTTVKAAMVNPYFAAYIGKMMSTEIAPLVIQEDISEEEIKLFISQVTDRFLNPNIEHLWLSISVQYTSKMNMRVVPLIERNQQQSSQTPNLMALGFAAYILFMRSEKNVDGSYFGRVSGKQYQVIDDKAGIFSTKWATPFSDNFVKEILTDSSLFSEKLYALNGFTKAVNSYLEVLLQKGVLKTLQTATEITLDEQSK